MTRVLPPKNLITCGPFLKDTLVLGILSLIDLEPEEPELAHWCWSLSVHEQPVLQTMGPFPAGHSLGNGEI